MKLEDREGLHFALTGAPHHVDLEGRGQLLAADRRTHVELPAPTTQPGETL